MTTSEVSTEDFVELLAQLRLFVREQVMPLERVIAQAHEIPPKLREQAKELGLFGYAISQQWGGIGLNPEQEAEFTMELGYTSIAFRSMFGTNNGIAGQVIAEHGTSEQKERWLPGIASGDIVASFALTEAGAGSNPTGLKTRATKNAEGWAITGEKRFITNAPDADVFITFAKVSTDDDTPPAIGVFLVPRSAAGVTVGRPDMKMGQAGALTADVHFDAVQIPASALVSGELGVGYRAALSALSKGRITIAALSVGQAQRALDESVRYARVAEQGGTRIGDFQLVQAMLADQQVGVSAGRALVNDTARSYASGVDRRVAPSIAKLFCTEMAGRVADLAVQVHGGSGYMQDHFVEQIYRDVRLLRLYEGTSEIQRLIIGSHLVGKPA